MKIRLHTVTRNVSAPLSGGQHVDTAIEIELRVHDQASDAEIAAATRRGIRISRLVSVESYWETRAIWRENGVDPDAPPDEAVEQATAEAERRGGHL